MLHACGFCLTWDIDVEQTAAAFLLLAERHTTLIFSGFAKENSNRQQQ